MIQSLAEWMKEHQTFFWWFGILVALSYLAIPFVIRAVVVRMSSNYFLHRHPSPESWRGRHPAMSIVLLVTKNLLGVLLVVVGIVQSIPVFVPGFGALTILIGILLLNFPGKRRLELWLVRQKPVLKAINWIRQRSGRRPLKLPTE